MLPAVALFEVGLVLVSMAAGTLGSILGLGGGIMLVPALTLLFGVNIRYAIGASIVSVIATSSGAASSFIKDRITNIRLAAFLEIATTTGALCGALLSALVNTQVLYVLFAVILVQSAALMIWKGDAGGGAPRKAHPLATRLRLNSSFPDRVLGRDVSYLVLNVPLGFVLMWGAGVISALLGIGSGALKVLAMDTAMRLPIKVSSATSNFMIGVTAAASAGAYLVKGDIVPELAAPVTLGVVAGAWIGTHLMRRLSSRWIRGVFVAVLVVLAVQMVLRGLGIALR